MLRTFALGHMLDLGCGGKRCFVSANATATGALVHHALMFDMMNKFAMGSAAMGMVVPVMMNTAAMLALTRLFRFSVNRLLQMQAAAMLALVFLVMFMLFVVLMLFLVMNMTATGFLVGAMLGMLAFRMVMMLMLLGFTAMLQFFCFLGGVGMLPSFPLRLAGEVTTFGTMSNS